MPASEAENNGAKDHKPRDSKGWDGKLRIGELETGKKQATLVNPEALSDPDYSDPEAPPTEVIEADEGTVFFKPFWKLYQYVAKMSKRGAVQPRVLVATQD